MLYMNVYLRKCRRNSTSCHLHNYFNNEKWLREILMIIYHQLRMRRRTLPTIGRGKWVGLKSCSGMAEEKEEEDAFDKKEERKEAGESASVADA